MIRYEKYYAKMNEIDKGFLGLEIAYRERGMSFPTDLRITPEFRYMWE